MFCVCANHRLLQVGLFCDATWKSYGNKFPILYRFGKEIVTILPCLKVYFFSLQVLYYSFIWCSMASWLGCSVSPCGWCYRRWTITLPNTGTEWPIQVTIPQHEGTILCWARLEMYVLCKAVQINRNCKLKFYWNQQDAAIHFSNSSMSHWILYVILARCTVFLQNKYETERNRTTFQNAVCLHVVNQSVFQPQ